MYLVTSSGVGGAERQVRDLAIEFRRRNWTVTVVSMLPLEATLANLSSDGIRTATLRMVQGIPDPRALVRLVRLLRATRPDVLHAHMVHANLLARLARLFVRLPLLVCTMHNQDEGGQWRYVAYRLTDRLTDVTTTVSALAMSEAVRRGAVQVERIRVVPNGVDLSVYHPGSDGRVEARAALGLGDDFTWLAAGRLTAAKAPNHLISAFASLEPRHLGARLLIAGDGELRQSLAEQIDRVGLREHVHLLGVRADLPSLMRAADGFVMSSLWEGLPLVLLEAAASGLPIVATDVGGSRDAVVDGESGFLVPPDNVLELAVAMDRMMRMPATDRQLMAARGRRHVADHFALPVVADAWERLYRSRLSGTA